MSTNKRKTTNSKTNTKSTRQPAVKRATARVSTKQKQLAVHKRHMATISGVLLCLGAIAFAVFFVMFWVMYHTCDLTQPGILSSLEIVFVLPLFVNILSLICALDCKHPLHSRTVIMNIITIALEAVFIVFVPLYLIVLQ